MLSLFWSFASHTLVGGSWVGGWLIVPLMRTSLFLLWVVPVFPSALVFFFLVFSFSLAVAVLFYFRQVLSGPSPGRQSCWYSQGHSMLSKMRRVRRVQRLQSGEYHLK